MSEMTMRVAKAIAACHSHDEVDGSPEPWERHIDEARAAIEAMREPTEEMLASPQRLILKKDESKRTEYLAAYRCYIDAALA